MTLRIEASDNSKALSDSSSSAKLSKGKNSATDDFITLNISPITQMEQLTDIDLGLLLFERNIVPNTSNLHEQVKALLDANEEHQRNLVALKSSKNRWNKVKFRTSVLGVIALALGLLAEDIDQLADPSDESQRKAKTIIVMTVAGIALISGALSYGAELIYGRRYHQHKESVDLHHSEKNTVKKMQKILEAWGKLERARLHPDTDIDVETIEKKCFKSIKKLTPEEITGHNLPDQAGLASITIHQLPDGHPIRTEIDSIRDIVVQKSSSDGSFKDKGQQGALDEGLNDESNQLLHEKWAKLRILMHGLYVPCIYCVDGCHVHNHSPKNPYFNG